MPGFRYSVLAREDVRDIAEYTIRTWGIAQADRYLSSLEDFCQALAEGRAIGRESDDIAPDSLRIACMKHVVFYRLRPYGVRVLRVLHQRQLPSLHSFVDDEGNDET